MFAVEGLTKDDQLHDELPEISEETTAKYKKTYPSSNSHHSTNSHVPSTHIFS